MPKRIDLLIDWTPTYRAAKKKHGRAMSAETIDFASVVFSDIRDFISQIALPGENYEIQASAFGGFLDKGGAMTDEATLLASALARDPWPRRVGRVLYLPFDTVSYLSQRRQGIKLQGLFRPNEPILDAHLKKTEAPCTCKWRADTTAWLINHDRGDRICPTCTSSPESAAANLSAKSQKLVDTLLVARALDRGLAIIRGDRQSIDEVWICSSDADMVPGLGMLADWGVRTTWIQPFPNTRLGYAEQLRELGVTIRSM